MMKKSKKTNYLLIATWILATLLTLFFLLAFGPKLIDEISKFGAGEQWFDGWQGKIMVITFLVAMIAYVLAFWNKCIGGYLFLLASIIQMGPFLIIEQNYGSFIFGLPLLVVGILFLVLCKQKKLV